MTEEEKKRRRADQQAEYRRRRKLDPDKDAAHRAKEVERVKRWKADPNNVEKNRAWYNNRAREGLAKIRAWLAEYKLSRGCADCGYKSHPAALDFDHVGDDKSFTISQSQNFEAIKEEVKKCVVRCSNCHRVITHRRLCEKLGLHDALQPLADQFNQHLSAPSLPGPR